MLLRLRQCLRRRVGGNGGAAAPAARVVPPGRAERVPSTVDHRMPRTTPAEDARVPATLSVARDRCRASIHISRLRGSACRAVGLRRSLSWSADWCRERGGAGRVVPPPYGRCRGLLGVWPYVGAQRRAVSRIPYRGLESVLSAARVSITSVPRYAGAMLQFDAVLNQVNTIHERRK